MSYQNQSIYKCREIEREYNATSWQLIVAQLRAELNSSRQQLQGEIDRLTTANATLQAAICAAPMLLWATDTEDKVTLAEGKGLENLGLLSGEAVGVASVSTEISDRDRSSVALQIANQELECQLQQQTEIFKTALTESERKYQNLVETSQELIWSVDLEGLLTFVNSVAERIYGYEPSEMIGHHFTEFLLPEHKPLQIQIFEQLLDKNRIEPTAPNYTYETVHIRKDGTHVYLRINSIVNKAENGSILGLTGTATDIGDRKRSEEALQKTTDQLWAVLNAVPGLISWIGSDLRYIGVNQHLAASFHRSPENFVGKQIGFIEPETNFGQLIENFFESSAQQTSEEIDIEINGSVRNYLIVAQKYNRGTAAVSVGIDISDRKRAEAQKTQLIASLQASEHKFRSLYEATSDAVMLLNEKQFFDCNPATLKIFGCTNKKEFYGKHPREFSPLFQPSGEDSASLSSQKMNIAIATGSCRFDWVHKRLDGSEFPAEVLLNVMEINGQKFLQAVVRDITERKRDEDQIKASLAEKEVLLQEIHHRVKNNLQVISSLLKLQSRYIQDNRVIEMLKESRNRVRSMALVHEQLYQSKDLSNIDFAEYIENLAHNLFQAYEVNAAGIKLETNIARCDLNVNTAVPCGLIINELVTNSLKYAFSEKNEGKIKIDFNLDRNGVCVLVVSDTGVGFPKDLAYRNARTLGLRLVGALVRQIRGNITLVESAGTVFRIIFSQPKLQGETN